MRLYFAGAEIPSHRKVLTEVGATHVALSFMGLRRRIKHPEAWLLAEKFPDGMSLLLDSGAFTVNKSPMDYTQGDLKEISEAYQRFVSDNVERVELVSDLDAMALGRNWIEEQREGFYSSLDPNKFMPIWHPEWGVDYLQDMAQNYVHIGIPTTDISGRNLAPVLNRIASDGVSIHGVGLTSVDDMSAIRWSSVSSTSWVSPQQYGDTIVWTGRELKRYPKKSKAQARLRYRTLFEREGFDAEKIANDDSTEVLRLSIWSWGKLVEDIERKSHHDSEGVTPTPETASDGFVEVDGEEVDPSTGEMRNSGSTVPVVRNRAPVALPVLGSTTSTVRNEESGEDEEVTRYHVRSESERRCDTCFLAKKCPAFEPGSNCAYNIPLTIRTRQEAVEAFNSLIEMQYQRTLFMRFAEELEGGYADPNLSVEMDRLTKMMKVKNDMDSEGFSVKFEAKGQGPGSGNAGVIARLFGDQASHRAQELPAPVTVEQIDDIVDGEVSE